MNRSRRLERLRKRLPGARPEALTGWWTEDDVLAACEQARREGIGGAEPDFPRALAEFRHELETARARASPPFGPPADFLPNLADLPHLRVLNWRTEVRFPELCAAGEWLLEILGRALAGAAPLSEAEFADLAAWFAANDARLQRRSNLSGLLDLGGGRHTTVADLRYGLAQGPRAGGAGKLAEDLRTLRRREDQR